MYNDMRMMAHTLYVKVETGCRILMWWPSVFRNRSFISAVDWDISSNFGKQIDCQILNRCCH